MSKLRVDAQPWEPNGSISLASLKKPLAELATSAAQHDCNHSTGSVSS